MNACTIVGYTYRGAEWHQECMIRTLVDLRELSPAAIDMKPEDVLNQHAAACAIDREDESSFDSDDFPKVIFADDVEPLDICDRCSAHILLDPVED